MLNSELAAERATALAELAKLGGEDAFRFISRAFDDQAVDVRSAAARALYDLQADRAASFTETLREGSWSGVTRLVRRWRVQVGR